MVRAFLSLSCGVAVFACTARAPAVTPSPEAPAPSQSRHQAKSDAEPPTTGETAVHSPAVAEQHPETEAVDTAGGDPSSEALAARFPQIGVPSCDEYTTKYQRCIEEHAPESLQTQLLNALEQSHQRFAQRASAPSEHAEVGHACDVALDAAKRVSVEWGCEF